MLNLHSLINSDRILLWVSVITGLDYWTLAVMYYDIIELYACVVVVVVVVVVAVVGSSLCVNHVQCCWR